MLVPNLTAKPARIVPCLHWQPKPNSQSQFGFSQQFFVTRYRKFSPAKHRTKRAFSPMGRRPPSPDDDIESGHHHRHHKRRSNMPPPPPPNWGPPPPRPWTPWLVPLIFLINIALFWYSMYLNNCPATIEKGSCLFTQYLGRFSFQPFKENPLLGPSTTTLEKLGGLEKVLVVEHNEAWRLFSCMFLHAGVIHILANMFSLLFIGVRMEEEFGFLRVGLLYLLSGLGGSLLSLLNLKESAKATISVGASGALFGCLGAMLSELLTNWTIYINKCTALVTLVLIIGLNLAVGLLPNVDNSAHVGGFLAGFFLGFVLLMRPQYGYVSRRHVPPGYHIKHKSKYKCYQYCFLVVALIILLLGYAYCIAKLFIASTLEKLRLPKSYPR